MTQATIEIARDFSTTPGGRYKSDSEFSGEVFRDNHLLPKLRSGSVTVILDGVEGFGSSFLEEAFGGLVRKHHLSAQELRKKLTVVARDRIYERYAESVWKYIDEASEKH